MNTDTELTAAKERIAALEREVAELKAALIGRANDLQRAMNRAIEIVREAMKSQKST